LFEGPEKGPKEDFLKIKISHASMLDHDESKDSFFLTFASSVYETVLTLAIFWMRTQE
jgi:hypothetical protein